MVVLRPAIPRVSQKRMSKDQLSSDTEASHSAHERGESHGAHAVGKATAPRSLMGFNPRTIALQVSDKKVSNEIFEIST